MTIEDKLRKLLRSILRILVDIQILMREFRRVEYGSVQANMSEMQ